MKVNKESIDYHDIIQSEKFREFFEIIRNLLGIQMSLSNPGNDAHTYLFPRSEQNKICALIQAAPGGLAICHDSDRKYFLETMKTKGGLCYTCHAGLIDFMVPVFVDGRHVATFNGGQILPAPPDENGFEQMKSRLSKFEINPVALRKAYFNSPHLSREKTESILKLISMFAEYIFEKGIRLKKQAQIPVPIQTALNYMNSHFRRPLAQSRVAARVSLSASYFGEQLKKHTGISYSHYLQTLRVTEARKLLGATKKTVIAIAYRSGFGSLSHFNRVFRAFEGCSPKTYRKDLRRPK